MRFTWQNKLRKELQAAGATPAEADELLPIAADLRRLRPARQRAQVFPIPWQRFVRPALFVLSGAVLGMAIIAWSQSALPTSWLYPVQKLSDAAAVAIHPQYRASVMMKRAEQVNELVAQHADSRAILATLADYSSEAAAYQSTSPGNYAAFEYCKTNLTQAATSASPSVRQAILGQLQQLQNI